MPAQRNLEKIRELVNSLGVYRFATVQTVIKDRSISVGHLTRCVRFQNHFDTFCDPNEIVFYRRVPNYNDVYSFKERTIALNINVYGLLVDLGIRLVITDFKDHKTVVSAVAEYKTESDLGIGYLRRCAIDKTFAVPGPASVLFNTSDHVGNVYAEPRESAIAQRITKREHFDPRQNDLF